MKNQNHKDWASGIFLREAMFLLKVYRMDHQCVDEDCAECALVDRIAGFLPEEEDRFAPYYHSDGTVTYWDVFSQRRKNLHASRFRAGTLETFSQKERDKICLHHEVFGG